MSVKPIGDKPFKKNTVEENFYEYVQNHGATYSGITMIPFKNDSAAVAIDIGRDMPTYKAGLRSCIQSILNHR